MDDTVQDAVAVDVMDDANEKMKMDSQEDISMIDELQDEAPPPAPFTLAITPPPETPPANDGTIQNDVVRGLPSEKTLISVDWAPQNNSKSGSPSNKRPRSDVSDTHKRSSKSKLEEPKWQQFLYSPQAGTTTSCSKLLKKLDKRGLSTPTAIKELEQYANYELETFTFLQEIIPNLFLGSLLALDSTALQEAGITRVLTVMQSNPHLDGKSTINGGIAREYIMMKDIKTFQSHPWYQTTSAIIDSALHAGERILIHCRMGISRSATVVAAYLTFRHGLTPDQAVTWIRLQRPIVHPNPGFQEQLSDYYSVLQMDHGEDFGWKGLSLCEKFLVNEERERKKLQKRRCVEDIRGRWREEKVEWVKCEVVGWGEDIERIVQRHITGSTGTAQITGITFT